MITVEITGGGNSCRVSVNGELTIEQASEFRAAINSALERNQPVTVELCDVTAADLACLQILCSACISSYIKNTPITINGLSHEVVRAVENSGLTRYPDTGDNCCWLSGGYHD